jgi:hypothetical protein
MYDVKKFEHDKNMWYNMSRFTKKGEKYGN